MDNVTRWKIANPEATLAHSRDWKRRNRASIKVRREAVREANTEQETKTR